MLCLVAHAALAFSAPLSTASTTVARAQSASVRMELGVGPETGGKVFDPLGFLSLGTDETRAFVRHAEIKHGRVAMLAFVGWLFAANHVHFPGTLDAYARARVRARVARRRSRGVGAAFAAGMSLAARKGARMCPARGCERIELCNSKGWVHLSCAR
jgi:hypothetical protein